MLKNIRFGVLLALLACSIGYAAAPTLSAYFDTATVNTIPKVTQYIGGYAVFGDSKLVDNGSSLVYNGSTVQTGTPAAVVYKGSLTVTTATTDAVTITGIAASSSCTFSPTNVGGATDLATIYISTTAANTLTFTHPATTSAGDTYNITCVK
jgi:hypothetical protein